MNKLEITRAVILTMLLCLLVADAIMILAGWQHTLPHSHKQVLLTGVLLWFCTLLFNRNRDDDWVGQV